MIKSKKVEMVQGSRVVGRSSVPPAIKRRVVACAFADGSAIELSASVRECASDVGGGFGEIVSLALMDGLSALSNQLDLHTAEQAGVVGR